jgi:hypothetical protein
VFEDEEQMMASRHRALTTAVLALAVTAGGAAGARASGATNLAAAQADTAAVIAGLALPPGAIRSAVEPAGDGSVLANPPGVPATPDVVDDHAWWIVPGTPAAVVAYVAAHPPAGATCAQPGGGDTPSVGYVSDECSLPQVAGVLDERALLVVATRLPGGSTGLRADAQAVWLVPRSATERIPAGARRLVVSVTTLGRPHRRPVTVTSRRRIDRVRALLDALPLVQPGVRSCPAGRGVRIRLAFYARGGRTPLAVAGVDPSGCGDVSLTIRGRTEPPLTSLGLPGTDSLVRRIDAAIGVELTTSP